MRHITGIILSLAMSAALFFGGGWGVARISAVSAHGASMYSRPALVALAALLGTGLLLGLLIAAPSISPLGSGLPGIAALAWSVFLVVSARHAIALVPLRGSAPSAGFGRLLQSGALALAGTAMTIPLFVPSRWRRRASEDEFTDVPTAIGLVP